jgi:methyl-accepting chemotaxis protein
MKKLSLKNKIILLGSIPFTIYLLITAYDLYHYFDSYKETKDLLSKVQVISSASELINETQKERGKSAAYLNGGLSLEELNKQRAIADGKRESFLEVLNGSSFSEELKQDYGTIVKQYPAIRKNVTDKKVQLGITLKTYTGFVMKFLSLHTQVASETSKAQVATALRSFRILENAKESGGKLRANMSAILANNKPLSDEKFTTIVFLKSGIDQRIHSSGLVIDQHSKDLIKKFESSREWGHVNETFQHILKKSGEGNYGGNAKEFFGTITKALNVLGQLIVYQKGKIHGDIKSLNSAAFNFLWKATLVMLIVSVTLFYMMLYVARNTSQEIFSVSENLFDDSMRITDASQEMMKTGVELSQAATEQSSSLQEIVTSINEINAMVQKNADASKSSADVSNTSIQVAEEGKSRVDEMVQSIGEIASNIDVIMGQVENNNDEIAKVVHVIEEIQEKTKVINDIVFQTKLLSFNASVEAARAGENGKGFAVVAEEVGNLASMSGRAASEISELIESSTAQVESIVKNSKRNVESLIVSGKEKVSQGTAKAQECGAALDQVLDNVKAVNELIHEISSSSAEQSSGIQEITSALQQLDTVTHQNSAMASQSSLISKRLKERSERLNEIVKTLNNLVSGNSSKAQEDQDQDGQNNGGDDSNEDHLQLAS